MSFNLTVKWYFSLCILFSGCVGADELTQMQEQVQALRQKGEMGNADKLAARFSELAQQQDNQTALADAYYEQARNAMERNLYVQAQSFFEQSLELYQGQNNQQGLGDTYRQLGLTYRYQSHYDQALEYINLAMEIYQQLQNKSAISSTYNSIGLVLEKMGHFEEAAQAHQSALTLHYELNDQQGIASALYNLGDLRKVMGDHEVALGYFQDALKMDIAAGNVKYIAYSHNKIGAQFITLQQPEQARFHINEALRLFRQIQTPRDTDWALSYLAKLETHSHNYDQARLIIDGVLRRAAENQYNSLLVDAYLVSAELAYQQQDSKLALTHIEAGLVQAKLNNEPQEQALLEKLGVQAYVQNDDIKAAFDALQRQKKLDEAMFNEKRLDSIANVQAQTEFVRRAQQIKLLENEKLLQQAEQERQHLARNLWIMALMTVVVLLFLLYGRFVQRRVNKKLAEQVAQRTRELHLKNSELQNAYQEMQAISLTDNLTGLHNRRFLENQIESDLEQSLRVHQDWRAGKCKRPNQADVVLFMIDMDHFKLVNDHHGHSAGDDVLKQLTLRMAEVFRQTDYLVRWGGEEFIAVARAIDRQDAPILAQRLLEVVGNTPFILPSGKTSRNTCSIGYACYPVMQDKDLSTDWQSLISLADICLYQAKDSGRNAWVGIDKALDATIDIKKVNAEQFSDWQKHNKIKVLSSATINSPTSSVCHN
ncbi:MAG: two-component system cell cycle response regulator [Paraglaciecola sp.]